IINQSHNIHKKMLTAQKKMRKANLENDSVEFEEAEKKYNDLAKELETIMQAPIKPAYGPVYRLRKSPRRKSPKRKSPKRKSPKCKSPKRKSSKRKSSKRK